MIEINADVGEMMGGDEEIMAHISVGNIACGYHASNLEHMAETVRLAVSCGVKICAHPGYRDVENFGRVSVSHSADEIMELVGEQVRSLGEICREYGTGLFAIKPHGALYHDMMEKEVVRGAVVRVASEYGGGLPLVVQAMLENDVWGVEVKREVFADRAYLSDGRLMARSQAGSLHLDPVVILAQARLLIDEGSVRCGDGSVITLPGDTLCFHGDNPASVTALKRLNAED